MSKDELWTDYDIIGYVALGEDGRPYRAVKLKYGREEASPPRIYTTMDNAVRYSPVDSGAEVRMYTPTDEVKEMLKNRADSKVRKAEKRRAREAYRKKVIPEWCESNLKPGMIVKVKSSSGTIRKIESVKNGYIIGRHVSFTSKGECRSHSYITEHMFHNITAVQTGITKSYCPIFTTVIKVIEDNIKPWENHDAETRDN